MTPQERLARFKTILLATTTTQLPTNEQEALGPLIKAAQTIGEIFIEQNYAGNKELEKELATESDQDIKALFELHKGPFDRTLRNEPFIEGHVKPKGANLYPPDMTKKEFGEHLKAHPEDKAAFENLHTIIRRAQDGTLTAVAYRDAYREELQEAARQLHTAAAATANESLKRFLTMRAQAFSTDEYKDSDIAWLDLDGQIEVTIGPYEVYEDELFGLKTTFEAFIGIKDEEETAKVKRLETLAPTLEEDLPLAEEHRNYHRGASSPIIVVNELYAAGDCAAGVHFTAYNLPNDEDVREERGSKKVLIKNIARAKYQHCWTPIIATLFEKEDAQRMTFEAYFTHILLHEISHGLGPGKIRRQNAERNSNGNGRLTTVNAALKDAYSVLEEAKADLLGVHNAYVLAERGELSRRLASDILYSFVGGIFRSIRFGIHEAHGGANIIAYNLLLKNGGVVENGLVKIDEEKAKAALAELITTILDIQARGDYEAAKALIGEHRHLKPSTEALLARIEQVPIDIRPVYGIEATKSL